MMPSARANDGKSSGQVLLGIMPKATSQRLAPGGVHMYDWRSTPVQHMFTNAALQAQVLRACTSQVLRAFGGKYDRLCPMPVLERTWAGALQYMYIHCGAGGVGVRAPLELLGTNTEAPGIHDPYLPLRGPGNTEYKHERYCRTQWAPARTPLLAVSVPDKAITKAANAPPPSNDVPLTRNTLVHYKPGPTSRPACCVLSANHGSHVHNVRPPLQAGLRLMVPVPPAIFFILCGRFVHVNRRRRRTHHLDARRRVPAAEAASLALARPVRGETLHGQRAFEEGFFDEPS
ncbi:hypothetical protein RJ55_04395 [Drechmeria coniospora]|nr:hypothetical protein RJ55_04395 [Drechmeria coniospora]